MSHDRSAGAHGIGDIVFRGRSTLLSLFHSGRFNQELYDFTFSSERYDFDVNTAALNRSVVQSRPIVQLRDVLLSAVSERHFLVGWAWCGVNCWHDV
jgi:hypothetical protein